MPELTFKQAVIKAADFIEQHPDRLQFSETRVPLDETGRACQLGWVEFFMGMRPGKLVGMHRGSPMGLLQFFQAMDRLDSSWTLKQYAPEALRKFANLLEE